MTTLSPGCSCEQPAAVLLRECVLVLVSALTLGLASPFALMHIALHLPRSRAQWLVVGYLALHVSALVTAFAMLEPGAVVSFLAVSCLGIAVVATTLPHYRRARVAAGGWCTCRAEVELTTEPRRDLVTV